MFKTPLCLCASIGALWLGVTAAALRAEAIATPYIPAFQSVSGLGNTVVSDTWTNLSSDNHLGYPGISGSEVWPAPIAPDAASSRQSVFQKMSGSDADTTDFLPASAGGGIYSFFSNTHFELFSGAPLANVNKFQLQLSIAEGATSADVVNGPTLSLSTTSGVVTLNPNSSSLLSSLDVTIPAFGNTPTTINLEAYTWDVSPYVGTINSATLDWQVDMHSITYGGQLAQAAQTVPEPTTSMCLALGGAFGLLRIRGRVRRLS